MNAGERAILALLESQGYRCALTGRELAPKTASLDHKLPATRGGTNEIENVWLVHSDINRAKGTMTAEEFIQLCHEVVRYHRRKQRSAPTGVSVVGLPLFEEA